MAEGGLKPPEGAGKGGGGAAGDGREAGSGDWASIAAAVGQQAISMLVAGQPQAFVDFFYLACQREEGKECVALSGPGARALPALLLLLLLLRENSPPWLGRPPPPLPRAPPRGGPGARGMHAKGRLDLDAGWTRGGEGTRGAGRLERVPEVQGSSGDGPPHCPPAAEEGFQGLYSWRRLLPSPRGWGGPGWAASRRGRGGRPPGHRRGGLGRDGSWSWGRRVPCRLGLRTPRPGACGG